MSGGGTMNEIMGGLQMAAGAAATAFGQPEIGIPLMTSGVGSLSGTSTPGSQLQMQGGGMYQPGQSGTPGTNQINQALARSPGLSSLQNQFTGVSGLPSAAGTTPTSTMGALGQTANAIAPAAQAVMNATGLNPMQQPARAQPLQPMQVSQMQRAQMPTPQTQTPVMPTAAGGGAGGGGGMSMPSAAGTIGSRNPLQQILAMIGAGPYA